jgi:FMN phosphatase YigB (HAD superfamily)
MPYGALICSAFDTILRIGREQASSVDRAVAAVNRAYCGHFGRLPFADFERAYSQSRIAVTQFRRSESKEIRNQEQMRVLLRVLGHQADEVPEAILDSLTTAYVDRLARATEVGPETIHFVEWAARRFRLAIVANADCSRAVFDALHRFRLRSRFAAVVVSDDVGWRMPHRIVFERALGELGVPPEDALFVGDRLYPDVYGAINSRLDSACIAADAHDARSLGFPAPTHTVRSLLDLIPVLQEGTGRAHQRGSTVRSAAGVLQ